MKIQRVWLSGWEWACCGDPFEAGESVSLRVDRSVDDWLSTLLGTELTESIDAVESHHEDGGQEEVVGVVVAIHGVTLRHEERRMTRSQRPAPAENSAILRSVSGWVAKAGGNPDIAVLHEPIPGSASVQTVPRVPWPPRYSEPPNEAATIDGLVGYLIDLEVP